MKGTLKEGEPHPAAYTAKEYLINLGSVSLSRYLEAFSSCAISGDRPAEICSETLSRLMKGDSVSDRYLLGLAWAIRDMEEK